MLAAVEEGVAAWPGERALDARGGLIVAGAGDEGNEELGPRRTEHPRANVCGCVCAWMGYIWEEQERSQWK